MPTSPRHSGSSKTGMLIIMPLKVVQTVPCTLHKDITIAFTTVTVAYISGGANVLLLIHVESRHILLRFLFVLPTLTEITSFVVRRRIFVTKAEHNARICIPCALNYKYQNREILSRSKCDLKTLMRYVIIKNMLGCFYKLGRGGFPLPVQKSPRCHYMEIKHQYHSHNQEVYYG